MNNLRKDPHMPLFIVQHRHSPETCPARDKNMASRLLSHLSPENAERFGVRIQSEAVVDGGHALYLTLEATDKESVSRFMQPFAQAGSVDIFPASRCEAVVDRGVC